MAAFAAGLSGDDKEASRPNLLISQEGASTVSRDGETVGRAGLSGQECRFGHVKLKMPVQRSSGHVE